jgi:predicted nucleotidyltransferase
MIRYNAHRFMIQQVAQQLGSDLLSQVAFVGGCTTGLHITDEYTKEKVRYTEDVDLIIHVLGYTGWHKFSEQVIARGFKISMEDEVNCRFRLGSLCVDFMPDDENVLGYSNQWYSDALATAQPYPIDNGITIRLVTPSYFLATKFEAFKGRGNGDLLASRDMEDILNLVDGREELLTEVRQLAPELKTYLANAFTLLLEMPEINYLVQSTADNDSGREEIIFERLERLAKP